MKLWRFVLLLALSAGMWLPSLAEAQWRRSWAPPNFPDADFVSDGSFVFCRVLYDQVRDEWLGHGWNTDYPDSDANLMQRLGEVTGATVRVDDRGEPDHYVVRLTDEALYQFPFLFMSDVGTVGFGADERAGLRDYLLKGGFLWVDDFWGDAAWSHWSRQIAQVLPPNDYPIVDIGEEHEIFQQFFRVDGVPQVPSIQYWGWTGETSERGSESAEPHLRGIFDPGGRLLVLMSHNTDIADGWEREGQSDEFFELFSLTKSYPLGINVVLYVLSH